MKSSQYSEFGTPNEVVSLIDVESHALKKGEARIRLEFSVINPADLFVIMGVYPIRQQFPVTPGNEGVGTIIEIGGDVKNVKIGDKVLYPFHKGIGVWEETTIVSADWLTPLPENKELDLQQLAMASINPPSALYMIENYVDLNEGDWIIQNAANSGVGRCVIGFAKQKGLRTINVVRRESLVDELKSLGADIVIVDGPDLAKRVSKISDKAKIKLGLDTVAGDATHRIAQCLTNRGKIVTYGAMSMKKAELGVSQIIFKQISLTGFWYHLWTQTVSEEELLRLTERSTQAILDGYVKMMVDSIFSLNDINDALTKSLSGKTNGKVLIQGLSS